jgi:hypothetical protein
VPATRSGTPDRSLDQALVVRAADVIFGVDLDVEQVVLPDAAPARVVLADADRNGARVVHDDEDVLAGLGARGRGGQEQDHGCQQQARERPKGSAGARRHIRSGYRALRGILPAEGFRLWGL